MSISKYHQYWHNRFFWDRPHTRAKHQNDFKGWWRCDETHKKYKDERDIKRNGLFWKGEEDEIPEIEVQIR